MLRNRDQTLNFVPAVSHRPTFPTRRVETRCSRCGTVEQLTHTRAARVVRFMVPVDLELPHDDGIASAAQGNCSGSCAGISDGALTAHGPQGDGSGHTLRCPHL